ncbi:glycerophosphodiester phosphodiesterase family protein [Viridibacterium curvum]|uniref:glycerophosphodiester phosphodiesterase n=1 Tax=Viridibacterium curvum TaxID=1101404 RepID=A0ABP9QTT1_9RHOO
MRMSSTLLLTLAVAVLSASLAHAGDDHRYGDNRHADKKNDPSIQLGPRPAYLIEGMEEGKLKERLKSCENGPFYRSDFSIAHRGAPLQFPEHTRESYEAGAKMGAGIVECDVSFTSDGELVCRHSECDLHTTTNIVNTPLNAKCSVPWSGAGSSPKCCTSDITSAEYKTLMGKMDASVPSASTPAGYLGGTANWRTDLYTGRGTLLTLRESIRLNKELGVKHTPELKSGNPDRIKAIFGSQAAYAQKMIDILKDEGVDPRDVWAQSFDPADIAYWIRNEPKFGRQAVYLEDFDFAKPARKTLEELKQLRRDGVRIFAPPIPTLLAVTDAGEIVPSQYAKDIRAAGLDIITWSFERADLRAGAAKAGYYYGFDPTGKALKKDSDMYKALHVLARDVKIIGLFSDWPATVSYYASCMGY